MKAVLISEGAADRPMVALEGRTPLQVIRAPALSQLATNGRCGLIEPVGSDMAERVEVSLAALCGGSSDALDGLRRGTVEASGLGVDMTGYTHAFSGSFVTLDQGVMRDTHVWRLSREETQSLADSIQASLDEKEVKVLTLDSGRVIVLVNSEADELTPGHPPSTIKGRPINDFVPRGRGKHKHVVDTIMKKAAEVLTTHVVNDVRVDLGENPANALWLWGGGRIADLPVELPGGAGGCHMVTRSPMAKGIAKLLGMSVSELDDPFADTSGTAAFNVPSVVEALRENDFLVVYVEAPKELGFYGSLEEKLRALERLDQNIVEPIVEMLEAHKPYQVAVTSNGMVSTDSRQAEAAPVPLLLSGTEVVADDVVHWDETNCESGSLGVVRHDALKTLLKKE